MGTDGPRRCPVCGDEMVVVVAKTRGAHPWRGWHCRRCGHEERERGREGDGHAKR